MTYWQRLKRHPGAGIAVIATVYGAIAGASRGDGLGGVLFGAAVMSVWAWIPVLITARNGEGE